MGSKYKRFALWIIGALVLAACAPGGGDDSAAVPDPPGTTEDDDGDVELAGNGESLSVGFIAPLSGGLAGPGTDLVEGFELYLEQNDNMLGGRPVDLTVEDTQGQPDAGVQVATRLVEQVGVDIVVGPLLGNVGLAIGDYMSSTDVALFYPIPSSDTFLRDLPENMFVSGGTAAQDTHVLGEWAVENGYERVLTICQDYAFGHELCGGFVNTFTDHGGVVVEQLWAPLGTADYGPFVADISSGDFDAVFSGVVGADSVQFVAAYNDFGLKDQFPLLASLQSMDQSLLRAMGENAEGVISSGHFAEGADSPATVAFGKQYEEAYEKIPSYYSASGHLAGQWIDETLASLDGDMPAAAEFLDAARTLSFDDTAFGPITLDEHGNAVKNIYIRNIVDRGDGAFVNVVEETIPDIGPTYYYDYDTYISQPVYSRNYQGDAWPEDCSVISEDCPLE